MDDADRSFVWVVEVDLDTRLELTPSKFRDLVRRLREHFVGNFTLDYKP